ncbi:unnamed protein product [Caenorhabditis brenneri]
MKSNSMDVNTLMRINYRTVEICLSAWTNQDLNFFLTSWAAGKSNSKMEYADLNINKVIDLGIALNGLSPELRDPRTTKRKFTRDGKTYSVFGGIDIRRNDGKIATIQWIRHAMKDEIDSVPQEWIDEFESKKLVNTPPIFEEEAFLETLWEQREFFLPRLKFHNSGWEEWYFEPDEKQSKQDYYSGQKGCFQLYRFHCDHLVSTLLRLLENILYVFNSELHEASLMKTNKLTNAEFNSVLNWINFTLLQESIPFVQIYCDDEEHLYHILETFTKKITKAEFTCTFSSPCNTELAKRFRQKSEICNIDDLYVTYGFKYNSFDVNTLTRINFKKVKVIFSDWTNQDLNFFLSSWASGKSNSRMEIGELRIRTSEVIDFDVVLNGLSPEFKDPRNTKRKFTRNGKTFTIFGGIDIRRSDGKVATIQWPRFARKDENSCVPREWIAEFESRHLENTPPRRYKSERDPEEEGIEQWSGTGGEYGLPKWYRMVLYFIVW